MKKLIGKFRTCFAYSLGILALISCDTRSKNYNLNLLIVFPDQMRGQAIGFLKEEPVHIPNNLLIPAWLKCRMVPLTCSTKPEIINI